MLAEALAAKGGKAKLAAIKSLHMTATGTTTIQGQTLPVEIERVFVLPDKMRIDATIAQAGQGRSVAVDGKTGWQLAPDPKTGAVGDRRARRRTTWPRRSSSAGASRS